MSAKSSPTRYGSVAITIHWLTALAVFGMLISGQMMDWAEDGAFVGRILPFHVVAGILVGVLTVLRLVWWWVVDRKPAPVGGMSAVQERLAAIVHGLLYLVVLIMVASGIGMVALTGAAPQIFGGGALPEFDAVAPYGVHGVVSKLLLVLVIGHIGAALYHQFIRKDRLLGRMGLGAAPRAD